MRRFGIILCLVLLLASPCVALADVGQVHVVDDGWNSSTYKAITGGTSDHMQAACNFFSVDAYSQLNESQREYLMSNSTWTDFYHAVNNGPYEPLEYQLFPGFNFSSYELWSVDVDSQVYFDAKDLLNAVMSGELPGGSASVDGDLLPVPILLNSTYGFVYKGTGSWTQGKNPAFGVVQATNHNSSALSSFLASKGLSYYVVFCRGEQYRSGSSNGGEARTYFFASADEISLEYSSVGSDPTYVDIVVSSDSPLWRADVNAYPGVNKSTGEIYNNSSNDGMAYLRVSSLSNTNTDSYSMPGYWSQSGRNYYTTWVISNYLDKIEISTTPDPTPQPPVQPPDPGNDVPVTDPPTWPEIDLPDIDVDLPGITITWPTLAEGLDYTDLLRTIIARLESIGDILGTIDEDLSTHCQHLQRQIHEQAKYLGNLIVQGLHSDLSFLGTQIQSAYKSINQCIREQVGWLASQLQWVVNYDSDLDELEPWLQRIWNKIGKGSYYQPDPIDDEPGFLDWLEKLWEHIIGTLSEITDGALDELLVVLDDLAHRFPFSIPWDVMALLALFAHTPEPIAFTINLPDVPGLYGGVIEVDCSGWDWMAGMVRPVLLVMFAYRLAMWTPKALESLGLLGEFKRSE